MSDPRTGAALGLLPDDELHRSLLASIVNVARAIFGARAASVFLLDEDADELVFEAVSGAGEDSLVGRRFPSSTGIAGWVLTTRQPLVLDDVSRDPRFAAQAAESTGYVPRAIMAVPLLSGERSLGVLEVLDRPAGERFTMEQADLIAMFAAQAAIALDLLLRSRAARAALDDGSADTAVLARIAQTLLDQEDEEDRRAGREFLEALERVLARPR
ncbi:MAG: GAF domain-containing protein [Gaiellales bacterium]